MNCSPQQSLPPNMLRAYRYLASEILRSVYWDVSPGIFLGRYFRGMKSENSVAKLYRDLLLNSFCGHSNICAFASSGIGSIQSESRVSFYLRNYGAQYAVLFLRLGGLKAA